MVLRLKRCFLVGAFVAFAALITTAVLFMVEESKDQRGLLEDSLRSHHKNKQLQSEEEEKIPIGPKPKPIGPDPEPVQEIPTTLLKQTTTTTPTTKPPKLTSMEDPKKADAEKKAADETKKANAKPAVEEVTNDGVHIFYYPWYGNPEFDNGSYYHWNHQYMLHWNKIEAAKWPKGQHKPPEDIGSTYYPQLGCYSSRDLAVIKQHFRWIKSAGVGTVVVSWYPPGMADDQGGPWDDLMPSLLDAAKETSLKVTFHIEPYTGRSVKNLRSHIEYIVKSYGDHSAMYQYGHFGKKKPLLYIYDSYQIKETDWKSILHPQGADTIRGTKFDAHIIGLLVKDQDKTSLLSSGFDGVYTYFASNGFTYGSTWGNWPAIRVFAKKNKLIFIPSVGPGYNDERVRPWNGANTKDRRNGAYYNGSFTAAVDSHPDLISITSFNEWHEGTQIEPAVPQTTLEGVAYADYKPNQPNYYLELTKSGVDNFTKMQNGPIEAVQNQHVAAAVVQ